jgi:hypothetical protein
MSGDPQYPGPTMLNLHITTRNVVSWPLKHEVGPITVNLSGLSEG